MDRPIAHVDVAFLQDGAGRVGQILSAMSQTITTAAGSFDIDSWEDAAYDDAEGAKLGRVLVAKTYHGDIEGKSTTNLLTAVADADSAGYVGMERVSGSLHGRKGTFVLQHHAIADRGQHGPAVATIVPDSATGELRGLRGDLRITIEPGGVHRWTMEYHVI